MIHRLAQMTSPSLDEVGFAGCILARLHLGGVPLVETIVCTTALFESFAARGKVDAAEIERLLALTAEGDFAGLPRCFLRSSPGRAHAGLIADMQAERNPTALKHALERIYRSWSSDRARAARITQRIPNEEGIPAILIQPCYERVATLLTRAPETGRRTDTDSVGASLHNTTVRFGPESEQLIDRVEQALGQPGKLHLIEDERGPRVCAVKEQPLSPQGAFVCAGEFLRQGWIDPVEYVRRIEPRFYLESDGLEITPGDAQRVQDLGLAPGIAMGRLVFRSTPEDAAAAGVLVFGEYGPEDIRRLGRSVGALSVHGGTSGHCAVVCRQLGKPAVRLGMLDMDDSARTASLPDGLVLTEQTFALLNGQTGEVYFADRELTAGTKYRGTEGLQGCLEQLRAVLAQLDAPDVFASLPVSAQERIGLHRRWLREIGWGP